MTILQWLTTNYTPEQVEQIPTPTLYSEYIEASGDKTMTKTKFGHEMHRLGFTRKSIRLGNKVVKAWKLTGDIKERCPSCKACQQCRGTGYVFNDDLSLQQSMKRAEVKKVKEKAEAKIISDWEASGIW